MQEKYSNNTNNILKRLKLILDINTDLELCNILNIKPSSLSGWRKRNSLNYDLIFDSIKLKDINLNWLIMGKGDIYNRNEDYTDDPTIKEPNTEYKAKIENEGNSEFEITIRIKPLKKEES